ALCSVHALSYPATRNSRDVPVDVFLLWSGCRRVLRSFPTRRSSDLAIDMAAKVAAAKKASRDIVIMARTDAAGVEGFDAAVERADRKSTRLHSSHVESSYAVSCSKKKEPTMCPNRFSTGDRVSELRT